MRDGPTEEPVEPVKVPDDAILLPYDPAAKTGIRDAEKMLVPYAKYVELWNRAYPDKRLEAKRRPPRTQWPVHPTRPHWKGRITWCWTAAWKSTCLPMAL